MVRVGVVAGSQVMASSLAVSFDVLETANRVCAQLGQALAFRIECCAPGAGVAGLDCLVVPGLGVVSQDALDLALGSADGQAVIGMIAGAVAGGAVVASSCAGSFLVAQAGVLNGRKATTSWFLAPVFAQRYRAVQLHAEQIVVVDGPVITGGAAMAQLDVMLAVVARFAGAEIARLCARYLLASDRSSQTEFALVSQFTVPDAQLGKAERWIRAQLGRGDLSVEEMARQAGLHPKTFYRRLVGATGLSPSRFVQRVRLEAAVELLRGTSLQVEEIAARVGYADASTLRRVVRRELGLSASEMRARSQFA